MSLAPAATNRPLGLRETRAAAFRASVERHLLHHCLKSKAEALPLDLYWAMAQTVRGELVERWHKTQEKYFAHDVKRAYYLSVEFLTGRSLGVSLLNLGLYDVAEDVARALNFDLGEVIESEGDPGLGNGGLGRLAACFMDSLATLELPAMGYGVRYEYGIFEQRIEDGEQVEHRDNWLRYGNPWEIARYDHAQRVRLYGRTRKTKDAHGVWRSEWIDTRTLLGVPYDSFVLGHGTSNVNTLRLWSARATSDFDLRVFNTGDYRRAVDEKVEMENISKVLYPADHTDAGKELRLKQQYFFVACSLADIVRRYKRHHSTWELLPERAAIQLNDTHPAIAVPELMRLLVDEEGVEWHTAFDLTVRTFGYTNHSLLPEALETWSVHLVERLLPRHLEIIYELNHHFLRTVSTRWPHDAARLARTSLIAEMPVKSVRMAHLATIGSHSINGVAKAHTELMKTSLFRDFYELWPERFSNKTNGIAPRRWLMHANPRLTQVLRDHVGDGFLGGDLGTLLRVRTHADDVRVLTRLREVKQQNKDILASTVRRLTGVELTPEMMTVCQVKRIHEYKRQVLACLEIVARYLALKAHPEARASAMPRAYVFAGKAAPGYAMAKLIVHLINDIASVLNADEATNDLLRVAFLPNYGVSLAQVIIPAADVSLQISLAGHEASGTSNMKFALNGALTIGTLDGANIELREAVGNEHFLHFGLSIDEVRTLRERGYHPKSSIAENLVLREVLDLIEQGFFSLGDPTRYHPLTWLLRTEDPYMVCADFASYVSAHERMTDLYRDPTAFYRSSLFNIAGGSQFSSDATIHRYAEEIWKLKPVPVDGASGDPKTLSRDN